MSHAMGQVRFPDGEIMHFEYNGTADVCIQNLYATTDELIEHWRNHSWFHCNCVGGDEPVEIACDYGNGEFWGGRACRKCRAITAGFEPGEDAVDGVPTWWVHEARDAE